MSVIHIHRHHHLGLPEARKIAFLWAEQAEEKFDMECAYEEGDTQDTVYFTRAGIKGTLQVLGDQFEYCRAAGHAAAPAQGGQEEETRRAQGLKARCPADAEKPSEEGSFFRGAAAPGRRSAALLRALARVLLAACGHAALQAHALAAAAGGQAHAGQRLGLGGEFTVGFGNDLVAHGGVSVKGWKSPIRP